MSVIERNPLTAKKETIAEYGTSTKCFTPEEKPAKVASILDLDTKVIDFPQLLSELQEPSKIESQKQTQ